MGVLLTGADKSQVAELANFELLATTKPTVNPPNQGL